MTTELLTEFSYTTQILEQECISIVLMDHIPTFDHVYNSWKEYRKIKYVIDVFGEPKEEPTNATNATPNTTNATNATNDTTNKKYFDLFDIYTLTRHEDTWLCLLFENGDEVIIHRDITLNDAQFIILKCEFSRAPDFTPRNKLKEKRIEDGENGEFVIAILHKKA